MGRHGKGKSKADSFTLNANPLEAIQNSIWQRMHQRGDLSRRFICDVNLGDAWEGYSLERVFPPKSWTPQDLREIKRDYRKILSILILIDWQGFRTMMFRSQFFRQEDRKDANLPFTIDQLGFLGSARKPFFDCQHAFTPAIIEYHECKHIQTIESPTRLPFVERRERMGIGSYGEVLKVSIARGFYQDKSQKTVIGNWSEVKTVAVKVYHSESSEKDFHEEVKRLDYLKEGYQNSRRVMKHIAAIVHGDIFMIVLPLAELRDLEVFLRGGRQPDSDTRSEREVYNFDDRFEALKDDTTLHRMLIRECFEISSALLWLHEELRIYGKLDRYLAHMDLKPDNILIDSEEGHLAGKWMISDFGVSLFDKVTNEPTSDVLSARDIGRRATSRANQTIIHRNQVGYSPPEIGLPNCDGRKCDVWSFVCILCDVLAFALGRTQGLHGFRNLRFHEDDNFFEIKSNHKDRKKKIDESNTEVKKRIHTWLQDKETEKSYPWVPEFVKVIRQGLIPDPINRPEIRSIMTGLDRISIMFLADAIISIPTSSTSTQNRRSQQLQVPINPFTSVSDRLVYPQEAEKSPISFDTSARRSQEDCEVGPSNGTPLMGKPTLNDTSQMELLGGSRSILGGSTSQPLSSSNIVPNVSGGTRTLQRHRSNSHDTQGSQMTNSRDIIRSGQISRRYIQLSPLTLPLKPKATLNAVALHKMGEHIAMLFERREEQRQQYDVYIYPVHDEVIGIHKFKLSSRVHWTQIWTAQRYFAVGGQSAEQKFIEVHDLQNERNVRYLHTSHPRYKGRPCSQLALSDAGIAACIYGPHVILANLRPETSEYGEFRIDEGYSIKKADFGAVSHILCIWAIKCVESKSVAAVDVVYFYNVTASKPELISKAFYSKAKEASMELNIMPFPKNDACVIREKNGGTFIAHPNQSHIGQAQGREYSGIPRALAACVTFDGMLICVEKHQYLPGKPREIHEYPLRERDSFGSRYIGSASKSLGSVDRIVDETARIAIRLTEDHKQMLVLCTSKGVVLRFLQSD